MNIKTPAALTATALFLSALFLSSCALTKPFYLGADIVPRTAAPQLTEELRQKENVNGDFPAAVYIKTRTQTFNSYHYYILREGKIWYKSIDPSKEPQDWTLFAKTGIPHNAWRAGFSKTSAVAEIAADADELVALSYEGGFYRYCIDPSIARKNAVWHDRQGWPQAEQLFLDARTAKNLSWALGKRNKHVLYYEDPFGNQHHNGTMEIATTYMLLEDGQEICYADTGLPADFSRNFLGPERGAFKAVSLSASASTMFVINAQGKMYTRLADFDAAGCDPMFFKYTYIPYKSELPGTDYFSNLTEWALPAEDWRGQPAIQLAGKAAITRCITILQNGQGNAARELRVAGLNESGETGFWSKGIFDSAWHFVRTELYFDADSILQSANPADKNSSRERGVTLDAPYSGFRWQGGTKEADAAYAIPNFNMLEGDCELRITRRGETCVLKLHPVEMWTYLKREYLPGRTGSPKLFWATLEIPHGAFDGLSESFIAWLTENYLQHDRALFAYTLAASTRYLLLRNNADENAVVFLTDGTLSDDLAEFSPVWYVENFLEAARYYSPELVAGKNDAPTIEELRQKIALNKMFHAELKRQNRQSNWAQLTAFEFNASYIPAHYIALITPLRFIDVPKIRTITGFGDKVVLANSAYISAVSAARIWVNEKIIALLETRIRCYEDLLKTALRAQKNNAEPQPLPAWYAENISAYWDIAGLPRAIHGEFFSPSPFEKPVSAVLRFAHNQAAPDIFGWELSAGGVDAPHEQGGLVLFIDAQKSAAAIYARKGLPPAKKTLVLDCVLYFTNRSNDAAAQQIIAQNLAPFGDEEMQGIPAKIIFDGNNFTIRQHPAKRSNTLIFAGAVK